jgi:hypothetical protein
LTMTVPPEHTSSFSWKMPNNQKSNPKAVKFVRMQIPISGCSVGPQSGFVHFLFNQNLGVA